MNLRELEYLVALADQRNFHRAAAACGVSQPTLSAQIRKLEQELGVALFERAPRRLILTQAGEAAVRRARTVLDEVAQLRDEAARHSAGATRRLHLGVFPTLGPYLLPHVVPRFMRAFPATEILLTEEKSSILLRRLIDGQIDAVLLAMPVEDAHVTGRKLFSEPFRLAVPASHALAGRSPAPVDALASQNLMLLEEGHCLRDQALSLCRRYGAREYDDFRGTSLETLRQMVIAGMGVTLLPQLACTGHATSKDMALLPLESGDFRRDIGLFWRKTSGATDLMEQLAATITTVAGQLIGQGGAEAA
ncbi:LysR family hydrogen peroxide-inducible transcriptional activator [Aquamicrobium lusatiense]|uniref:LysR family hydrogen peroxide-inducible transcriptional activator n=1 Tax=Aquamicrobium lusatiense TaxID=89772 RepID=A0A7W9S4N0_9HYPH|nr:LysR substrate-binding domain-containing protein [Aquamicrobium lusatiense]MBB6014031.1 LysR family hydrogen peroxide-inducible transcriptional activator [Aquamicrobium lusatiense]